ncbi:MAG: TonB-dependent receptor plug domain-containing protein [Alphaproteobacteria bacterium]|nr:TonB-dependent receptor plug domain-containing protein [Alphaproteobacteria bacterium]
MPNNSGKKYSGDLRSFRGLARSTSSLVFIAAMAAGPALAQQVASNQQSTIETITVTAQYVTQNVQKTPLAISVVTAQDLEQRGINDLSQVATSIPSLTLTRAPAAYGNGLQTYIRGIGAYDTAFAGEPGVGMYVDDLYFGTLTGSMMDLLDLSRIEVLKGPQGVLGGKNDLGGAVRLFTQKPTDDNSGYLQASYGSFNEIDVKGVANFTLIPNHLFMRLTASSRHQDGHRRCGCFSAPPGAPQARAPPAPCGQALRPRPPTTGRGRAAA